MNTLSPEKKLSQSSRREGVLDDIFSYFSSKPYVETPYLKCLIETVQMRGHNIWFYAELTKISLIITKYSF